MGMRGEDAEWAKVYERLDRIERVLERLVRERKADHAELGRLDEAVCYVGRIADRTAHDHWDLVDVLTPAADELDPEPSSRPLPAVDARAS